MEAEGHPSSGLPHARSNARAGPPWLVAKVPEVPMFTRLTTASCSLLGPPQRWPQVTSSARPPQQPGAPMARLCARSPWNKTIPVIVPSLNGSVIVVWFDSRTSTRQSSPSGSMPTAIPCGPRTGCWWERSFGLRPDRPVVVADRDGGAYVIWVDHRSRDQLRTAHRPADQPHRGPALGIRRWHRGLPGQQPPEQSGGGERLSSCPPPASAGVHCRLGGQPLWRLRDLRPASRPQRGAGMGRQWSAAEQQRGPREQPRDLC